MIDTDARLLRRGDYIWGSFVRSGEVDGYIRAVNPGDRTDVLGDFAFSLTSVDDAVGAAQEGFASWSGVPLEDRADAIARLGELVEENGDALANLITRETGKPRWEAQTEVAATARVARMVAREGADALEPQVLKDNTAWSNRRPHGVIGVITPFTYPLVVPAIQVLSALLGGNCVVYKPSKFTPGVGQALAELLDGCRLPRGAFNMVQGSGAAVGARLASHPGIDGLAFTGSHDTARKVQRALADRPELPVWYQCGGKSSALVLADADLDLAAFELCVSAFATAGQRHDAAARLYIAREVFDVFCERLVARTANLRAGYGFDPDVFLGPMISDAHRKRFRAYVDDLSSRGHTPVLDGGAVSVEHHRGYYVRPAVHWVTRDGALDDEPPGPVVQVYCVQDTDQAVDLHERQAYRVSTAIFTQDPRRAEALSTRLNTGAVFVNRGTSTMSLKLPAVGRGRASNGVPGASEWVRAFTAPQALLFDRRAYDTSRFVPGAGPLPDPS